MLRLQFILFLCTVATCLYGQDFSFTNYYKSDYQSDALDERFSDYQIVDFDFNFEDLKTKDGRVIESQFLFDSMIAIDLYPSYLLSGEYKKGIARRSENVPMTYYGYDHKTVASLTLNKDFIYGFIRHQDLGEYYIEPLSFYSKGQSNQYVIYKSSDVKSKDAKCGVNETAQQHEGIEADRNLKASSCEIVNVAIASDLSMYERYGSIEAVENHNIGVMNCVNSNYIDEFDVNFEFEIATQFVATSENENPLSNTTNISILLNEFAVWTNRAPWFDRYDIYQYWSAMDIGGASVGLSFQPGSHHVIEDFSSGPALQALAAHEIGHNFSATHVSSQSIMFNSVIITNAWDPLSVSQINNRLLTIGSTLENCVLDDVPIARVNSTNTVLCGSGVVRLDDKSIYGTSRMWSTSGGEISSTTSETITFQASTPGTYIITLESTNSLGTDAVTIEIEVQSDNSQHCTPSNNVFGSGGLASWSILDGSSVLFSNSSSSAAASGNYENFYCTQTVSLEPNSTYTVVFTTLPCNQNVFQYFRVFIDYNDDGDFLDSDELAVASNLLWCGGPIAQGQNGSENGLIFRTPSSPLTDRGLRLRVLVDDSGRTEAATSTCYSPTTGQIEDYRLVFGSTEVSCSDGIQNQGEESVDCGGPCAPCVTGCDTDADAYNYSPNADIVEACETCFDGIQNGDEGGVDCGGSYPGCPSCDSCSDGVQNQGEESVDCGGPCAPCVTGCDTDADAYNYAPNADIVEACETCFDGIQNGDEGGVDCGGSYPGCPSCDSCSDGVQNQGEESVDCGGPCAACVTGCDTDADAYNYSPNADMVEACETCFDGIQNGDEGGVDCGGSYPGCPSCDSCSDGIQNQGEESVDCGGPCAACVTGCDTDVDAYNYTPDAHIVEACETCFDGIQNGDEGGVDCGGSYPGCPSCDSCSDGIQNQGEESIDCGGPCEPCPVTSRSVSGRIVNTTGQALENVEVTIGNVSTTTDNQGRYTIDGLPTDRSLSIAASNNDNAANGISSLDIVLITRHILGIQTFEDPYQLIAADVNNNGSVSAADLVGIQRVLLNLTSAFDGRPSWLFIPEIADLSESSIRNGVQTNVVIPVSQGDVTDINFIGVKIGDINASASLQ